MVDLQPCRRRKGFLNYNQLQTWLKHTKTPDGSTLEAKLEGGSFEALIQKQEQFYRERYGTSFQLDRSKIRLEKFRLSAIRKGLETGAVNYPLVIATPEIIDHKLTAAHFAHRKLLEPLRNQDLKIWAKTGTDRWTGLTLTAVLRGYIPIELSDFNPPALEADWQSEIKRIIAAKRSTPDEVQAGQAKLVSTDSRQDVPRDQQPINQQGQVVKNKRSFIEMIKSQVKVLTPQEWITLAAQSYAQDKTYLSINTWDWLMAVLDHQGKIRDTNNPPVSAARANSNDDGVSLNSDHADYGLSAYRWRLSL